MALLLLTVGPDPIFKKKSTPIEEVTDEIRTIMDDMLETLYHENGLGMGAPMVGILKHIVVVDMKDQNTPEPLFMVNPEITSKSTETQIFEEASLCFPGISAKITRPKTITVEYLDYHGTPQTLTAEGFFGTTIQHEIDYLHGICFFDHLSSVKRNMLLKKYAKLIKQGRVSHNCSSACNH